MNVLYKIAGIFFSILICLSYSSNPPIGKTGAPGEGKCSDCHSGGNFSASILLKNLPDTVIANKKYTFLLSSKSSGPIASGFELICINKNNQASGVFSSTAEMSVRNSGGKQYLSHLMPKDYVKDTVSWKVEWQAPNTGVNDTMNFYYGVNLVNKNGNTSGDNPVFGKKRVFLKSATSVENINRDIPIDISINKNSIIVNGNNLLDSELKVYNIHGILIYSKKLVSDHEVVDINNLSNGLAILTIQNNDWIFSRKILIHNRK
ncbi:MAG: T9SS type A sorting domain-containing protein [Saprospiraceae bacterium]|nr:T9SS type A sorting domain-containing protein [Saprospiraceae bacterium]